MGIKLEAKTDKDMAKADITIPLGIPDVRVLQTALNERGEIVITIESTKAGTRCRKCGKWLTKLHGRDEWVTIRHLPVFYKLKSAQFIIEKVPTLKETTLKLLSKRGPLYKRKVAHFG